MNEIETAALEGVGGGLGAKQKAIREIDTYIRMQVPGARPEVTCTNLRNGRRDCTAVYMDPMRPSRLQHVARFTLDR